MQSCYNNIEALYQNFFLGIMRNKQVNPHKASFQKYRANMEF